MKKNAVTVLPGHFFCQNLQSWLSLGNSAIILSLLSSIYLNRKLASACSVFFTGLRMLKSYLIPYIPNYVKNLINVAGLNKSQASRIQKKKLILSNNWFFMLLLKNISV